MEGERNCGEQEQEACRSNDTDAVLGHVYLI